MPLIKEFEDLLPLVAEMDEKHQRWLAGSVRAFILLDEDFRTMSKEEVALKYRREMSARRLRQPK